MNLVTELFWGKGISIIAEPANSADVNPVENSWWKWKRMGPKKVPTTETNLLTAILESWNHFDVEYCFRLSKFMSEKTKVGKRARGRGKNPIFFHK